MILLPISKISSEIIKDKMRNKDKNVIKIAEPNRLDSHKTDKADRKTVDIRLSCGLFTFKGA